MGANQLISRHGCPSLYLPVWTAASSCLIPLLTSGGKSPCIAGPAVLNWPIQDARLGCPDSACGGVRAVHLARGGDEEGGAAWPFQSDSGKPGILAGPFHTTGCPGDGSSGSRVQQHDPETSEPVLGGNSCRKREMGRREKTPKQQQSQVKSQAMKHFRHPHPDGPC